MLEKTSEKQVNDFNATTVSLAGSNLIEASAGTGKTYSIAILVLRLLIEQKMPIQKILMVTFTKAAVAELEERIRKFVRLAHKASKGEQIKDKTIEALVKKGNTNEVQKLLDNALLFLDETSILTIHSFCQQTLNQFAFETQQLFGVDLLPDSQNILNDEVNKFWRKNITKIPVNLLHNLVDKAFSRKEIAAIVKEHLAGKKYLWFDGNKESHCLNEQDYELFTRLIEESVEKHQLESKAFINSIIERNDELNQICNSDTTAKKNVLPFLNDAEAFVNVIKEKRNSKYIESLFPDILKQIDDLNELKNQADRIILEFISKIYCHSIEDISHGIQFYKSRYNQINYDDLIKNLHTALYKPNNQRLTACLQEQYEAVFIDEFQDTDKLQYEIFQKAFADKSILFYIGDPKQSIYAWRKADIFTYFKAKNEVDHLYSMNQNFRSSESFIYAMNDFFTGIDDTFYFGEEDNTIKYIPVQSPDGNTKGNLLFQDEPVTPITIYKLKNKEELDESVVAQIIQLLSQPNYKIEVNGVKRLIVPSDIGILIRTGKEGRRIKKSLAKYGIPSINIDEGKVLQSDEASFVLYLMQAVFTINLSNINRALLSPFTGFKEKDILRFNDELIVEQFKKYKETWEKNGIYTALNQWILDFDIKNKLLKQGDGERLMTNLYQIIELLHKTQSSKSLNNLELMSWLQRGIEGMETDGDEYLKRIESDEEAIKIVTIHKSKGLEYNIVFAPFLDLKDDMDIKFAPNSSFRDPQSGDYFFAEKSRLDETQKSEYKRQNEQENRRLIYVAITRAVYKCFIYKNEASYYKDSSLDKFLKPLKGSQLINFENTAAIPSNFRYQTKEKAKNLVIPKVEFTLLEENWRRLSYSTLRTETHATIKPKTQNSENDYDQFIFSFLKKGAKTGNMLHYIFENIQFNDENKWEKVIEAAINRFVPNQKELYLSNLKTLLNHVLNASIQVDGQTFSLSKVNPYRCIHEFEFDFNVKSFYPQSLSALATENTTIDIRLFKEVEGMMNGKIDLFFEHENKYYVLDWKSNYLGDDLEDYAPENLNTSMNENNYHLQYLIYSLAAKKYLESRIKGFHYDSQFGGVVYLFVRGMRAEKQTGIFAIKPTFKTLASLNYKFEGDFN